MALADKVSTKRADGEIADLLDGVSLFQKCSKVSDKELKPGHQPLCQWQVVN